ncbi:protein SGT1 homolog B-like isoform X2 [Actinidia eriantha]|uniref:protein SGT1 homolog B-like isoform X2 n=1 Tax=Actinidia eriantha TaxID=165200 RepID=UPI002585168D|nr:protein SGT1 homolog B-like isoform X2 [Actinidia eriantha]
METDLAERAKEAFVDDDFETAVDLYTQAISLKPKNADLFADRAQANIKLKNFTEAVADANKAIELDPLMTKAYLRKGTACFKLEEYHTAKAALEKGASLAQNDSRFAKLITKCDERIAEETSDLNRSSMPKVPVAPIPANASVASQSSDGSAGNPEEAEQGRSESSQVKEMESFEPKHSFYQKPEEVVVTIFAKGVPSKNVIIDFGEQILSVAIDVPGENKYHFQPRLFGKIVPSKCTFAVLSTKIEIRLVKADAINWPSLEYNQEVAVPQRVNVSLGSQRPTYPSSKPRTKDWDKLEAQVKKEEKEEKLDGDAALNKLFGDIYKNADEDMRRAMVKSFVESNGTVLSTNWQDVGSKKIEGSPPDGMELKKWEY